MQLTLKYLFSHLIITFISCSNSSTAFNFEFVPMSSPLKRGSSPGPDDGLKSYPRTPRLQVNNSVPCGDPRCNVTTCLNGPFTTLYFYPRFSDAEVIAEVVIHFILGCFHRLYRTLRKTRLVAPWHQLFGIYTARTITSFFIDIPIYSIWCMAVTRPTPNLRTTFTCPPPSLGM